MSHVISKCLAFAFLIYGLSSSALADSPKAPRPSIARQSTAADINRAFKFSKQEAPTKEVLTQQAATQAMSTLLPTQDLNGEIQLVAQYTEIMRDAISSNWSQILTTRNKPEVIIHMRLAPKGHIISSAIGQSSGEPHFDHAALQAVESTERFPELERLPLAVFERNFREFNLLLRPEDFLR